MQRKGAFTLIEIVLVIFILMLLLTLAVPSFVGAVADKRLRRSLDSFNDLVRQAEERSIKEQRAYLIVWAKDKALLRPEAFMKDEEIKPVAELDLNRGDVLKLSLPAALVKSPPAEWIFWPSGTCEPAMVEFRGRSGSWKASYSPLTGRPELVSYAAR
ncbi:MAG: Tfp pilus assembly protein FimT/FimU [Chthoniobacterales bacterium]